MKITVYTITDCKFSAQEKDYLKSMNVPFEEKNLETNKDYLSEMLQVSNNFAGTPVTVIEKDDGAKVVLKGFTKEEFEKELKPAGAPAAETTAAPASSMPEPAPAAAPTPKEEPKLPEMPEVPGVNAPAEPATPAMPPVVPPAMPEVPKAEPKMPEMPAAPEPMTPPLGDATVPAAAPANVPDLSGGVKVAPEPATPSMPAMPEPAAPAAPSMSTPEPVAPAAAPAPMPEPAAPSTPGVPAPANPAPQVNDDALNAILNNLQAKVGDNANPAAPKQ